MYSIRDPSPERYLLVVCVCTFLGGFLHHLLIKSLNTSSIFLQSLFLCEEQKKEASIKKDQILLPNYHPYYHLQGTFL